MLLQIQCLNGMYSLPTLDLCDLIGHLLVLGKILSAMFQLPKYGIFHLKNRKR